jgi:hypothetical protein
MRSLIRWITQRRAAIMRKKKARAWSLLEAAVAAGTAVWFKGVGNGSFSFEYGGKGRPWASYHLIRMTEITRLLRHERPDVAVSEREPLEQGISIEERAATLDLLEHEIRLGGAIKLCYLPDKQKFDAQVTVIKGVAQVRRFSSTLRNALEQAIAAAGDLSRS